MEWQHPEALYLILPLCASWLALGIYSNHRRHMARASFAAQAMWSRILPAESRLRFWTKLLLREVAIIAGLVALAGPKFGVQYEQVVPRGSDLYVLIDVSRSMLADDVPPSRLGRAKSDVAALVNRLQGERVGLIAFAGQAVVKCPLTVDYDSFRRALDELDPDSAPRGGTAIGDAIRKGLEVFHAKSDRDQAMLLITDGDDQQSYPLEAAAVAAERHVTIFTVGLGDADLGARVPQKSDAKSFTEYKGEQVWSKLDNSLLEQIALKTSGIYIPAGTRAYDLGELYADHLQGRRGDQSESQQRIRRSERYQIFLAIALMALLIDLCIRPYRRISEGPRSDDDLWESEPSRQKQTTKQKAVRPATIGIVTVILLNGAGNVAFAIEPKIAVREGLQLYSKEKYDEAKDKFAAAAEELDKQKSAAAAVAAFDEACAYHKKGDMEHARESYLRAGLSQDRQIATAAHFNLGTMAAEQARKLCGEKPETVAPDKRQEILDQLAQAIAAYRHCLELRSDHAQARRNLELVRQWIKYYSDQWRALDRQKRRDESNLIQFLEFLTQSQTALRDSVNQLPANVHSDAIAELKRAQEELREEIPTLRDKIATDLRPPRDPQAPANDANSKELEEGIALLREWADTAGKKMSTASSQLDSRKLNDAAAEQQLAIEELDRIWEAIIPFQPLLTRLLADQTSIAGALNPKSTDQLKNDSEIKDDPSSKDEIPVDPTISADSAIPSPTNPPQELQLGDEDLKKEKDLETKTLKRTRQLAAKAEMELQRLQGSPVNEEAANNEKPDKPNAVKPQQGVDPEQAKAGYSKAIELAPQAVEQMDAALSAMKQQDRKAAGHHAEEARKILEEIQKAQPKNEKQNVQQKQDQQKNEDQKKDDQQNKDDKKDGDQKKPQSEQKDEEKPSKNDSKDQNQQQQVSQDRLEDALRKVRERQQEKRERDRKMKGLYLGRTPVDKDW